jgi:hypothetical protein
MFWGWQALQKRVDLAPLLARIKAHETVLELNDRAASFDPIYERIQAYADRLTSTRKRGLIFTRRIRQAAYISQDYLLQPDVAAEIRGHYATIMQSGWAKRAA